MNIYIDFDNTLYETSRLTEEMIAAMSGAILSEKKSNNYEEILNDIKNNFNSTSGNIFEYVKQASSKHNVDKEEVLEAVDKVLLNGRKFVFPDAIVFLEKIKSMGDKIYLLTYIPKSNQEYQMKKIVGSGISGFFDGIIITTENKFELELDYEKGIFIDDDAINLTGLYKKNSYKVIRIRRPNNRHYNEEVNIKDIKEYESFDKIDIDNLHKK